MFLKFTLRALAFRKQRLLLAFAALAVAATLATVLFGVYGTMERRLRDEFRAYGANLAAVPAGGSTVPVAIVAAAEKMGAEAAPFLITSGSVEGRTVAVAGFVPDKTVPLTAYWHLKGSRSVGAGDCLAGESLARELRMGVGARVGLKGAPCTLRGIVSTGGPEDRELLVPFEKAAALAGVRDMASLVEIRADGGKLERVRSALAARFPGADVRTIRSVAETESNVVAKVRTAVFLLTIIILAITTLCVSSNFNEMVIERSKEIGILKALGGAEGRIVSFFVSEAGALALGAAVTGFIAGTMAAAAIERQLFGEPLHLNARPLVFLIVTVVMIAVAGIATAIATSSIRGIQPAVILRGD